MSKVKPSPAAINQHLQTLVETPRRLHALSEGLSDEILASPPGSKDWSAVEVLAHMRSCSDLWSYSIFAMLAADSPTLALLDARRWVKTTKYATLGFRRLLLAFSLDREDLFAVVNGLPESAWARSADIGGRKHTVFSQFRRMALHETEHLMQIEQLVSRIV